MSAPPEKRLRLWLEDREQELCVKRAKTSDGFQVQWERDGVTHTRSLRLLQGSPAPVVLVDGRVLRLAVFEQTGERRAQRGSETLSFRAGENQASAPSKRAPAAAGSLLAPMPGRVVAIRVNVGDAVEKGALLLVIEAMKMQNELFAATAGRVAEVRVSEGDTVERGATLIRLA